MPSPEPTHPAAPLDRTARAVTAVTAVILGVAMLAMFAVAPTVPAVLLSLGYLLIGAVSWALAPAGYDLQAGALVVRRNAWREVRLAVTGTEDFPDPERLGIRLMGSGGMFGYYGRFRRGDLGSFRAYLTTRDDAHVVALATDAGLVAVSPADPATFRAALPGGS